MCGIAGSVSSKETFDNFSQIKIMLNKIRHRGPDHKQISISGNFCGGYVRLSINDLKNGNQPFYSSDKNVIIFYNGELYNYKFIKKFLKSKGYKFSTNCDGEILPSLYEEFGNNFFKYLDGMFSISLWDKKKNKLILGRDYSGEKPLYYSFDKKFGLTYASEIKSVAAHIKTDLKINKQGLWDIPTFLWIPEPDTIYKSIKSLLPGQFLVYEKKKIKLKNFVFDEKFIEKKFLFSKKNIKKFLDNVILSRSLSDAKIGTFLSSGIDSSIINKVLSKKKKFPTYTVSFPKIRDIYEKNTSVDEYDDASKFAKKLKLRSIKISLNSKIILREFQRILEKADQPHAVSSAIGISLVSKQAKKDGIKVLISGDGADEIFGGYKWYLYLSEIIKLRKLRKKFFKPSLNLQSKNIEKKKILNVMSNYNNKDLMHALHYYGTEIEKKNIFSSRFNKNIKTSLRHFKISNDLKEIDIVNHDRKFYLTNEMLNKFDRNTMLNSIEGRSPFTSPYIKKIISNYKFNDLLKEDKLKFILKKNYSKEIGNKIINRKKHGFNFPIDYLLNNQWRGVIKKTFSDNSYLVKNKIIKKGSIKTIYKMLKDKDKNNGHTILSFIGIKFWLENNSWKL